MTPLPPITYRFGDVTAPETRPAIVAHVCNDVGAWGAGFVLAISRRWPHVADAYRRRLRAIPPSSRLGYTQILRAEPDLWIANMIAQHGIGPGPDGTPPLRYDALRLCLTRVALATRDLRASVHMPRIGCGLAGGEWARVELIIVETLELAGIPVTVYTLPRSPSP